MGGRRERRREKAARMVACSKFMRSNFYSRISHPQLLLMISVCSKTVGQTYNLELNRIFEFFFKNTLQIEFHFFFLKWGEEQFPIDS
jgi:hypothetical protein